MKSLLRVFIHILLCGTSLSVVHANMPDFKLGKNTRKLKYNLVKGLPDVYLDPFTEKIGHTWANGYVWDKPLIEKFYSLLPHNDPFVVFDLGAQTGSFTLLAKFFPNSFWYAFEPLQEAASTLKENLTLNDIHNVSIHQLAASDFSGKTTLQLPAMNAWGLATLGSNVLRFEPVTQRTIDCIDLDSFIDERHIPKVHFMKLDTEGSEFRILRGAKKMIMRDHPIILMEYNEMNLNQCGASKQDIDNFLKEMGYVWKLIGDEDIFCFPIAS